MNSNPPQRLPHVSVKPKTVYRLRFDGPQRLLRPLLAQLRTPPDRPPRP
jgi:hypothetical protein